MKIHSNAASSTLFISFKVSEVLVLVLLTMATRHLVEGSRILAVLPLFARSHHRFSQPLLKALARSGHEVVVYSPFPLDNPVPNYTDVFMDNVSTENEHIDKLVMECSDMSYFQCLDLLVKCSDIVFDEFIGSKQIQHLLKSKEHFDLVIVEALTNQEFTLLLGNIFKAPVISIQAYTTNSIVNSISGNTLSVAHIPDLCPPFSNKMSFVERLLNALLVFRNLHYLYYNMHVPKMEKRIQKHFPHFPPLLDMINNVSLIFVNDHLTADYARPRTPNIIPVAGIHIEDLNELPKAIHKFIDESTDGVILFSLGTYVPDELQERAYFNMYINVFRQLKQRILWKTRKENIQGLPDNVITVKWAPQRDILAHPKCVLFITHGGLLSQHEAVYFGVPVVVIPQFYDQYRNGKFYEEQGMGVQLNKWNLSEITILSAVRTVLYNFQYTRNAKRISRLFKDRPMTPAQTVVYWTEYVLRHGASHLRPASTQLSWYQLALLDVIAVIIVIVISVIVITYLTCYRIYSYINNNKNDSFIRKVKFN